MSLLIEARETCAAYWRRIGFPKDADTILAGEADYSADVQCVLAALIARDCTMKPNAAVTAAPEYVREQGSTSRNHREEFLN